MAAFLQSSEIRRDQNIESWNLRIYYWSRDVRVLCGIALVILAIAAGLGWWLRGEPAAQALFRRRDRQSLHRELRKPHPEISRVLTELRLERFAPRNGWSPLEVSDDLQHSGLQNEAKYVAMAYWDSLTKGLGEPDADLLYYAHYIRPLPFANELVGDLHKGLGDALKARSYYQREAQIFGSDDARQKVVDLLLERRDWKSLDELASDAKYRALLPPEAAISIAAREHHWAQLVAPLLRTQAACLSPMPVALACAAGFIWMIIALQSLQPPGLFSFRMIAPWFAAVSGMLSTLPTLFFVLWEEETFGLRRTGDFFNDIVFYVAGVGVREELLKLAFFLPFVPFLLIRRSRLEMLMVAGAVGLGFAISENLLYFHRAGPLLAFGRFLTANFFHLAATGTVGLALCEALQEPLKKGWRFPCALLAVIVIHGCYDAFLSLRGIVGASIISMICFVSLSLYFFRRLRSLRDGATDQLSISGTLIVGLAALTGAIFVCASSSLGFTTALKVLSSSLLALAMIVYMFYWQLGDGMSSTLAEESGQPA